MSQLEHDYFEHVTFSGAQTATMLSIATRKDGLRLKIIVSNDDGKVIKTEWTSELLSNGSAELAHVNLTTVSGKPDAPEIDLEPVPVSPSHYPRADVDVYLYTNSSNEEWAIGTDRSGQLWTFFKKPTVFGKYWIASKVDAQSESESQRVQKKLAKGYKASSRTQTFKFNANERKIVIR